MNGQGRSKGRKGVPRPHAGYETQTNHFGNCNLTIILKQMNQRVNQTGRDVLMRTMVAWIRAAASLVMRPGDCVRSLIRVISPTRQWHSQQPTVYYIWTMSTTQLPDKQPGLLYVVNTQKQRYTQSDIVTSHGAAMGCCFFQWRVRKYGTVFPLNYDSLTLNSGSSNDF